MVIAVSTNLKSLRKTFNQALDKHLQSSAADIELIKPMIYSLKNGGKRLRPTMVLALLSIVGPDYIERGMATAVALEYIHTYSLIHDDLPAMDNDDLRRGVPTNHKQFGEATAILAGDALLTDAFALIASDEGLSSNQRVTLIQLLSLAAGSQGMVAGQMHDLLAEERLITLAELQWIHERKTGCLFEFAMRSAGIIADQDAAYDNCLRQFAHHYGLAYQIHNDLKDLSDDATITGKDGRSDLDNNKSTYPALLTVPGAIQALEQEVAALHTVIQQLEQVSGCSHAILTEFIDYLALPPVTKERTE